MRLTPVKRIDLPATMADGEAQAVMSALDTGPEAQDPAARYVGGCVRNSIIGLAPGDIDIATQYTPDAVIACLQDAGIRVVETGRDHGTVTAIGSETGRPFEITTLRRDVATDGRHAQVAFSADWIEDARRRDFTMNTLLCDLRGRVYDPLSTGLADLESRHVRFVGDPAQRIAEDYLRILRFLRFHVQYGQGRPDRDALAACRRDANKVYSLARERIAQEFFKILAVENPVDVIKIMRENSILARLFHNSFDTDGLRVLCAFQGEIAQIRIPPRLLAIAGFDSVHYKGLDTILTLPNIYKRTGEKILEALQKLKEITSYQYRVFVYRYDHEIATDAFMLKAATWPTACDDVVQIISNHADWQAPALPVNGDDVQALGVKPGPHLGAILNRVEAWWLARDFAPNRDECLEYAGSVVSLEW